MTYAETLHFLYHSLPVFQHIGGNAYKPGFGNITELEKELGEPHRRFRSVHVAGTCKPPDTVRDYSRRRT